VEVLNARVWLQFGIIEVNNGDLSAVPNRQERKMPSRSATAGPLRPDGWLMLRALLRMRGRISSRSSGAGCLWRAAINPRGNRGPLLASSFINDDFLKGTVFLIGSPLSRHRFLAHLSLGSA
jgi:hypothetical protein